MKQLFVLLWLFVVFVACDQDSIVEPTATREHQTVLAKIKVHQLLIQTDSLMAIELMDLANLYYNIGNSYTGFEIPPEYLDTTSQGNSETWWIFYVMEDETWFPHLFGGQYSIERFIPIQITYDQQFMVMYGGEYLWGSNNPNWIVPVDEICGNNIDENLDGEVDEGCFIPIDVDNDGWFANINPNDPTRQLDCTDDNENINPDAIEIHNNNIDENCNGMEDDFLFIPIDVDGDGYYTNQEPFDCNDNNEFINSGMTEIFGDGIDNNCNGLTDKIFVNSKFLAHTSSRRVISFQLNDLYTYEIECSGTARHKYLQDITDYDMVFKTRQYLSPPITSKYVNLFKLYLAPNGIQDNHYKFLDINVPIGNHIYKTIGFTGLAEVWAKCENFGGDFTTFTGGITFKLYRVN